MKTTRQLIKSTNELENKINALIGQWINNYSSLRNNRLKSDLLNLFLDYNQDCFVGIEEGGELSKQTEQSTNYTISKEYLFSNNGEDWLYDKFNGYETVSGNVYQFIQVPKQSKE